MASIRSGTQRGQTTKTPGRRCVPGTTAGFDAIPGAASPGFFASAVREPKFSTPGFFDPRGVPILGGLGPDVLVSRFVILNWMTDTRRESSIAAEQRSGFRRRWQSVCGGMSSSPAGSTSVTIEDAGPEEVDRNRRRERRRREVQAGKKIGGKKMRTPCKPKFRPPSAIFLPSIFLPDQRSPMTQRCASSFLRRCPPSRPTAASCGRFR